MTLIEVLFHYRELWETDGEEAANRFLHNACDESLWEAVSSSINSMGDFVCADGTLFCVEDHLDNYF